MAGSRSRGFDWKEVAEVLRVTQTGAPSVFWHTVSRARVNDAEKRAQRVPSTDEESGGGAMPDDRMAVSRGSSPSGTAAQSPRTRSARR
jgi:hypothetical protein